MVSEIGEECVDLLFASTSKFSAVSPKTIIHSEAHLNELQEPQREPNAASLD